MATEARQSVSRVSDETIRFVERLPSIDDIGILADQLAAITRVIGFDVYVLGQLPRVGHEKTDFRITSYPIDWIEKAYPYFRYQADPVLDALIDADAPFLWEDVPAYRHPSPVQAEYIALSTQHGYLRGYSVPIRLPGEPLGIVSYATPSNGPVPRDMLPFAQQIAVSSFQRAHELVSFSRGHRRSGYGLTEFEIACLKGAAQGKSDFLISRLVDRSQPDVKAALKSTRVKLGVGNRTSMVVRALQIGFLTFNEALIQ